MLVEFFCCCEKSSNIFTRIAFVPGKIFHTSSSSHGFYECAAKPFSTTNFAFLFSIISYPKKKVFHSFFFSRSLIVVEFTDMEGSNCACLLCFPVFGVTELQKKISCKVNIDKQDAFN